MGYKYKPKKIKHIKSIYRKRSSKKRTIISIAITIVIIFGVGFLGYSVAKPLFRFFEERKNKPQESSSAVWTPPETTTTTTKKEESSLPSEPSKLQLIAYSLPVEALSSEQSLKDALAGAKAKGYASVVVSLKSDGGQINFASTNETAKASGSVVGVLDAKTISTIITDSQMTAVADLSILKDHIVPRKNTELSYVFENAGTMWLDNAPDAGGKAWLSPFSNASKTYLSQLVDEVIKAGFTKVIASDLIFPPFRPSDLNYVGSIVKDPNRHTALTGLAQAIKAQVDTASGLTYVRVPAVDLISGKSEVFFPAELNGISFVADLDITQIPGSITLKDSSQLSLKDLPMYDKVKEILTKSSAYANPNLIVPCIVKSSASDADFNEAMRAVTDLGYKTYFIK